MGVKWRDFQFPKRIIIDEETYSPTYGKFMAEPFERGYGATLGNALRRVLISSIEGAAATSIRIDGVSHEFDTIEGVVEDMPEIIFNIKNVVFRSFSKTPKKVYIKRSEKGDVKAADIITDENIEVANPNQHIVSLTQDINFNMEIEVAKGRGFVPAEMNRREDDPIGVIAVDSVFSPVRKVNFKIDNIRVGKRTDYDSLTLEIWTDASMEPKECLLYAVTILNRHLELFTTIGQIPEDEEEEIELTPEEKNLYEKLKIPVSELELSVRSANCLREAHIRTLADLVVKTEAQMLGFKNFGKKSLDEIVSLLKSMGLSLGMEIDTDKLERF